MPRYCVSLPITGTVTVFVEADSEKAAIAAAFERGEQWPEPDEWEVHEAVCTGNVFHGMQNSAEAREVDAENVRARTKRRRR